MASGQGIVPLNLPFWTTALKTRPCEPLQPSELALDDLILNALPDPIVLVDANRRIVDSNKAMIDLLGSVHKDQDISLTIRHPDVLAAVDRVLKDEPVDPIEVDFSHPVSRNFEVTVANLYQSEDNSETLRVAAIVVLHDITATRAAESFRTEFVANVSHELRSPLASLIGFIETLQTSAKDDAAAKEHFLSIMEMEASRMKILIDDLLSLSKIEVNEHIRPTEVVDVSNLLELVIEPLKQKAAQRSISIEFKKTRVPFEVVGDHEQLIQVFNNLVDNAIKYGRQSSQVTIELGNLDRVPNLGAPGLVVSVHNHGDPIAAEHLPRLTERFYRIDKGRSRSVGGTGLGLAIVKHMVNRHRGRLTIESEAKSGTTFSVFLPVAGG
jgi:two-component system, OmpR family, phosphate regulon sensor histidine kinase PhoR